MLVKPTAELGVFWNALGLAGEIAEDELNEIEGIGGMIVEAPHGNAMHEVEILRDNLAESFFVAGLRVAFQENDSVVHRWSVYRGKNPPNDGIRRERRDFFRF